eukprot:COSAG01_NODE_14_length_41020_cov_40.702133_10_plen_81_part_00
MKKYEIKGLLAKLKELGLTYNIKTGGHYINTCKSEYALQIKGRSIECLSYSGEKIIFKKENEFINALKNTEETFNVQLFS